MNNGRGRVCFFAPTLYPVAVRAGIEDVGGAEVIQWAFARGLAACGFDVAVATGDYGQESTVVHEGVSLLRTYAPDEGVPGLRFFYPRLWRTMRTLHGSSADVYLTQGSGLWAGWAYDAARLRGSRYVFIAASDGDAMPSLPWLTKRREKWWYFRALHGADARIAQTEHQRRLFRESFEVDTEVIATPAELPAAPVDAGGNDLVLWMSTYKRSKRPEWFTDLAARLPQFQFLMVGAPPGSGEGRESRSSAESAAAELSNLEVGGFVERERVSELLRRTALFVHTSPLEGFPMTLLEAWSYGIPTVSAVDPDGVIACHGMGTVVADFEQLVESVRATMEAPDSRRAMGARARQYVERHHGPERTVEPLAALLDRLISPPRTSAYSSSILSAVKRRS